MQAPYRSAFIGLRVIPDARLTAAIEALNDRLRQACRAFSIENPANYHLTLAFLGKPPLQEALEHFTRGVARVPAADLTAGPLTLRFDALRAFSSRKQPARILWAAPSPSPRLDRIALAFAPSLPPDQPDQTLHLTLARIRALDDAAWVASHLIDQPLIGEGRVTAISLLTNVGSSLYADLRTHDLTPA
jgi:2'-5' RNA ligase